jgi:protoheme IX farnesyltransferase
MLPVVDPQGRRTSRQALLHTVALFAASLAPVVYGLAGVAYLVGACVLSLIFLWSAIQFTRCLTWRERGNCSTFPLSICRFCWL